MGTDRQRIIRLLADLAGRGDTRPPSRVLATLGHPGYGDRFAVRVIRRVVAGDAATLSDAVQVTYHGNVW